jgi:glycerophosphoryl diester phosphodiesterase
MAPTPGAARDELPVVPPAPDWLWTVPLAHRGLHGPGVPENSLSAFEAACRAQVGIELDVRLTADGVAVISHDLDLRGVTGHAFRIDRLEASVLAGLRLLDSGEHVPTLRETLELIAGRVPVMVEVKNETLRAGATEMATAEILRGSDAPLVIASFNPQTIRWFARHLPAVARVQTGGSPGAVPRAARPALRRLLAAGLGRPCALSWNVAGLGDALVRDARRRGMPVTAWTVRTSEDLALARAGADNVIFEGLTPAQLVSG